MDRILRGDEELHRQLDQVDEEERKLETGNHMAARTFEDEPKGSYVEEEYMPEVPEPDVPGYGPDRDRVHFPLETFEETDERAPAVTGSLVDEQFSEDRFEATYEFRSNEEYSEEIPLISNLEPGQIEQVLEADNEDMNVTVSSIENGLMVTAQYDNPNSATEAVYEVNKVVDTLDQITDEQPQ